jgi:hypothetical protein
MVIVLGAKQLSWRATWLGIGCIPPRAHHDLTVTASTRCHGLNQLGRLLHLVEKSVRLLVREVWHSAAVAHHLEPGAQALHRRGYLTLEAGIDLPKLGLESGHL